MSPPLKTLSVSSSPTVQAKNTSAATAPLKRARGRTEQKVKTEALAKRLRLGEDVQRSERDEEIYEKFKSGAC